MRATFAEINLKNLSYNYLNIKKHVKPANVLAVIKADAYGHGAVQCAEALNSLGEDAPKYFGVAIDTEAIELRKAGIKNDILVFCPVSKDNAPSYSKYNLIATVFEPKHLEMLKAHKGKKAQRVHVKIDSGMGRIGIHSARAYEFIAELSNDEDFIIDGIFTHFATSDDPDKTYSFIQLERFEDVISDLKKSGISTGLIHSANSAAITDISESWFDMVRPGISLYGYPPYYTEEKIIPLKPVMSLISHVDNVSVIAPGESVSYGRKFIAEKWQKIASLPIGYADGYPRGLSNKGLVIKGNKSYRQIGTVCMDRIMFDIDNDKLKEEEKVILMGSNKHFSFDAWQWANILNTIPYEITCGISKRVPRIYI